MGSAEELMRVGKEIVDFHGEMVLLLNYSALNYTGELFLFSFLHIVDLWSVSLALVEV